jgi:hypothetical protein
MVALRRLVRRTRSPEERREEVAVPAGSNAYNSLWQVRTDAWSALEESTAQAGHERAVLRLTAPSAPPPDLAGPAPASAAADASPSTSPGAP